MSVIPLLRRLRHEECLQLKSEFPKQRKTKIKTEGVRERRVADASPGSRHQRVVVRAGSHR